MEQPAVVSTPRTLLTTSSTTPKSPPLMALKELSTSDAHGGTLLVLFSRTRISTRSSTLLDGRFGKRLILVLTRLRSLSTTTPELAQRELVRLSQRRRRVLLLLLHSFLALAGLMPRFCRFWGARLRLRNLIVSCRVEKLDFFGLQSRLVCRERLLVGVGEKTCF